MVSPFEKEYKLSKLIKQGKASIPEELLPLARWIDKSYDVTTLNILYDYIDKDVKSPRLSIIFEYEKDNRKFQTNNGLQIDSNKQKEVALEFKNIVQKTDGEGTNGFLSLFSKKRTDYKTDNLWVFFHDFDSYAKCEANENVPMSQVKRIQEEIGGEEIWTIVKAFSTSVFFFYTDEQVKKNEKNGLKEKLSLRYLELIKPYDDFNYFKEDDFSVIFDSKENFDKNYESNWYYYFK